MFFRQLFDKESSTYTYILADETTKEAIVIDAVIEQHERDVKFLQELGFKVIYAFDTHIHADHVTGMGKLKQALGCKIGQPDTDGLTNADFVIHDGDSITFGQYKIKAIKTPGHTNTDTSYIIDNRVFTGDCLFVRGTGRTDFQSGSAKTMYESITQKLFILPDNTLVYPAHDYKGMMLSTIAEEKHFNPRLTKGKDKFIEIMENLNLPHPHKIDIAVPANLACGL